MAHLAHELRTPVGVLVTAASLVDTSRLAELPEQLRRPLETMLVQARRLRNIVEDLLELSRLEAGHLEPQLEAVDLEQVVTEIVSGYGWHDVRVETSGTTLVEADRQSLTRLALNLVANARDHAVSLVEVTVRGTPDDVVLEVADDGPGLEPEQARVLTDPDRPRTSRARPDGHGLGLLIARAHADLLGAGIDVDAGRGRGTRVRVHLRGADVEVPRDPAPLL
jgi:two-component system sensor histidine kinase MtrB